MTLVEILYINFNANNYFFEPRLTFTFDLNMFDKFTPTKLQILN